MSRASRSFVRWREQAASVAEAFTDGGLLQIVTAEALLDGAHFDVHAAREWALAELRACDEADQHRAVLEDWTRDKGLGPENREIHAFRACALGCGAWSADDPVYLTHVVDCVDQGRGGWPGRLAGEFATEMVKCTACVGGVIMVMRNRVDHGTDHYTCTTHLVRCPCRDERRRYTSATNAAGRRRVAQRLLDTLDGRCPWAPSAERQPSECKVKFCHFGLDVRRHLAPCSDCSGTGHNLRGYLPAIEWPASMRRKAADSARSMQTADRPTSCRWDLEPAYEAGRESGWTIRRPHATDEPGDPENDPRTRVVPRGTHRDVRSYFSPWARDIWQNDPETSDASLDERITARGENPTYEADRDPSWRVGERRHESNRRYRAWRNMCMMPASPGTAPAIEAAMRDAAPSVDRVEVGRASEAAPFVVAISFHADTAQDARAAIRAAEEQRSAGMIYRYDATICAALSPIEMSIDFEIR